MTYKILPNGNLRIDADQIEMQAAREDLGDDFGRDGAMYDAFESLIGNSELDWGGPEEIGALTDAPILVIRGEDGGVEKAWGFMDYALRSPQDDLADQGYCIFQHG